MINFLKINVSDFIKIKKHLLSNNHLKEGKESDILVKISVNHTSDKRLVSRRHIYMTIINGQKT
jgi:hypothetical protein